MASTPTDPFTILELHNPSINVSVPLKLCWSRDSEALKLCKGRSGYKATRPKAFLDRTDTSIFFHLTIDHFPTEYFANSIVPKKLICLLKSISIDDRHFFVPSGSIWIQDAEFKIARSSWSRLFFVLAGERNIMPKPNRPFHNLRASESVDRGILCSSGSLSDRTLKLQKMWKGRSGTTVWPQMIGI